MDCWRVKFERCDPGQLVSEDTFLLGDSLDIPVAAGPRQGVVRTTPDHLQYVMLYLWKLNKGYATNLAALETAVSNYSA